MRALVVTNMYPSPERPAFGSFVRDQVDALRRRGDVEVELFAFAGGVRGYVAAARALRRRFRGTRFDVVHAHFGLTAYPAVAARLGPVVVTLHGNDLFDPRSNRLSRADPAADRAPRRRLARVRLAAARRGDHAARRGAAGGHRPRALPADPPARGQGAARPRPGRALSAVPARPRAAAEALRPRAGGGRRRDAADDGQRPAVRGPVLDQRGERRARAVPGGGVRTVRDRGAGLRRAGVRDPRRASIRSRSTGSTGAFCAPWDRDAWRTALRPVLEADDPRVEGRARAALFSADRMAARVVAAWRDVVAEHSRRAQRAPSGAVTG